MKRGMEKDFSWDNSAGKYIALYEKAIQRKKTNVCTN
jgi:glycogen synthase